jgi:hypothetical protein
MVYIYVVNLTPLNHNFMPDQNANPNPNPEAAPAANPADGLLLLNTTIVPTGNPELIIRNPDILKVVVIGNHPNVAANADTAATLPPLVGRKVVWFTGTLPGNYQEEFEPTAGVIAFSLSIDNEVKGTITDPNADYTDMEELFDQAGE